LLGLRLEVDTLRCTPCFPADWTEFQVHYRFQETVYHIKVLKSANEDSGGNLTVDGIVHERKDIKLVNDLSEHFVE
jgi:cyclic beta-1,2-glucan synthetase